MTRLTAKSLAQWRKDTLAAQGGRCAICQLPCSGAQAVGDHCHATGFMRGVLHRSCNSLLGKVENSYRRYGVPNLAAFSHGVPGYLQRPMHAVQYPTHKSDDEKRIARNAKARKARAAAKEPT
ncbi:Recombination endonuclease VII [uncultured Caudovirales phage]|uniref:Recombination endonuclease VII n=1 Tax=uncultured Caudovirales phage TaxID=2100421 RepID=A0A6J5TBW5_9CAUD|nr:Recombination endonuclease VII [uncultured Caudovirales phage]